MSRRRSTPTPPTNSIEFFRTPQTSSSSPHAWTARIGVGTRDLVEAHGKSACSAVAYLLRQIHGGVYEFDELWQPED